MTFEIGIGTSQNWDPEVAAEESIKQGLSKINGPPTFVLLFCTIHYSKNFGLNKIILTSRKYIAPPTPIIGGTVAGFINNSGCYSKGVTALICSSDEISIKTSIAKNTKAFPKRATLNALKKLDLRNNEEEFVFSIISGGKIPFIPFFKQGRVIPSNFIGKMSCIFFPYFGFFKKGVAKEDDILKTITTKYPEINLFSISTMDDEKMENNYQFYENKVVTDCIIMLKIDSNLKSNIFTAHGLNPIKKAKITKIDKSRQIIYSINNNPARLEFLEVMDWPKEYLTERIYDKVFFYPLAFKKNDFYYPFIPGLFLGNYIIPTYKIIGDEIYIMSSSGRQLLSVIESSIQNTNPKFILMSECGLRLQALGKKIFQSKKIFDTKFNNTPYLSLFVGGEATYSKRNGLKYGNSTFNFWSFEK